MPGFLVDGVCYRSQVEAAQARSSTESGRLESTGGRTYVLSVSSERNGTALKYTRVNLDQLNAIEASMTVKFSPPSCNFIGAEDAVSLAWKIALVWISVWAISHLKRHLR